MKMIFKVLLCIAISSAHGRWFGDEELNERMTKSQIPSSGKWVCPNAADVVFVIDDSGSIEHREFRQIKKLMKHFIRHFRLDGPKQSHTAAVLFNDHSMTLWDFDAIKNFGEFDNQVENIVHRGGGTKTASGLKRARNLYMKSTAKARVIVLLTDGGSIEQGRSNQQETFKQAAKLKNEGVRIVVVAVNKAWKEPEFRKEVYEVASVDKEGNKEVLEVTFNNLFELATKLAFTTCPEPKTGEEVCVDQPRDAVFLIDDSMSIGNKEYNEMKSFLDDVVGRLPISETQVRVGVMQYAGDSDHTNGQPHINVEFNLDRSFNRNTIKRLINGLTQNYGNDDETFTHYALDLARRKMFTYESGARIGSYTGTKKVTPVVIVITDGGSTYYSRTLKAAKRLMAENVKIISVGIGSKINTKELRAIASEPKNLNAIYETGGRSSRRLTFDTLARVRDLVIEAICTIRRR